MEILCKLKLQPLELEVACDMTGTKVRGRGKGSAHLEGGWLNSRGGGRGVNG